MIFGKNIIHKNKQNTPIPKDKRKPYILCVLVNVKIPSKNPGGSVDVGCCENNEDIPLNIPCGCSVCDSISLFDVPKVELTFELIKFNINLFGLV